MKWRTKSPLRKVIARKSVAAYRGVLVKVPSYGGLTYIPDDSIISTHYNSAATFPCGRAKPVLINRMFFGINPNEDCGRERIFDLDVQKWVLEDGEWYMHLILTLSKRKTAGYRIFLLPRERKVESDTQLSRDGCCFLRVETAQAFIITCGGCGRRVYSSHAPNPQFARNAAEARTTGKVRWLCPDCRRSDAMNIEGP